MSKRMRSLLSEKILICALCARRDFVCKTLRNGTHVIVMSLPSLRDSQPRGDCMRTAMIHNDVNSLAFIPAKQSNNSNVIREYSYLSG